MADHSNFVLDVMQAALSLAVKRTLEGPEAVTGAEIERAAELFEVGADDADQIMVMYEMLAAFGDTYLRVWIAADGSHPGCTPILDHAC